MAATPCLVIAPCTANTLAKLAHGVADNLLADLMASYQDAFLSRRA